MAIDTEVKRRAACSARRAPWFRRFALSEPDGFELERDRWQISHAYAFEPAVSEILASSLERAALSKPELTLHNHATTGLNRSQLVRMTLTVHDGTRSNLEGS